MSSPPSPEQANAKLTQADSTPTRSCCFRFVLQDCVVKGEGRRRHVFAVFSLCACVSGGMEQNGAANSVTMCVGA